MLSEVRPRTTLDGWRPTPGTYAWQQMYDPWRPAYDSTIEERIAHGHHYGTRRLVIVLQITWNDPNHGGNHRYLTLDADNRYNDATVFRLIENPYALDDWPNGMSATESDWCVLEEADAQAEAGTLW
jgi:hypothetical protein